MLGIEGDDPPASGATGGLNADAVRKRGGQQAIGIGVAQIVFCQKRELFQIVHRADVRRSDAFFLHQIAVVGDVVIYALHSLHQALILPRQNLFPGRTFDLGLIIMLHSLFVPFLSRAKTFGLFFLIIPFFPPLEKKKQQISAFFS